VKQRRAARDIKTSPPVALTVDRSRRLSEGALVQASVRARLLGLPAVAPQRYRRAHAGNDHRFTLCSHGRKRVGGCCRQHQ